MAQVLVLYNAPPDGAAFRTYYQHTHAPLAKKIPGLRSFTVSEGPVQAMVGDAPFFVATLLFDSMSDLQAGMASPEGQAAAADVPKFAFGGWTLLVFDDKAV
jgi:uncharacterized protein (TIGR02118 family)